MVTGVRVGAWARGGVRVCANFRPRSTGHHFAPLTWTAAACPANVERFDCIGSVCVMASTPLMGEGGMGGGAGQALRRPQKERAFMRL